MRMQKQHLVNNTLKLSKEIIQVCALVKFCDELFDFHGGKEREREREEFTS